MESWQEAMSNTPFTAEVSWDNVLPQTTLMLYSMGLGAGEQVRLAPALQRRALVPQLALAASCACCCTWPRGSFLHAWRASWRAAPSWVQACRCSRLTP